MNHIDKIIERETAKWPVDGYVGMTESLLRALLLEAVDAYKKDAETKIANRCISILRKHGENIRKLNDGRHTGGNVAINLCVAAICREFGIDLPDFSKTSVDETLLQARSNVLDAAIAAEGK